MATFSVFGTGTPDDLDNSDNDDYSLGTVVLIGPTTYGGRIVAAKHYATITPPTAPIAWRVSDLATLDFMGSHVFEDQTPGWVIEPLDTPIDIPPAGQNVLVWIGTPNRYVATGTYFTSGAGSAGIVSGPLTAPASAADPMGLGNGRFGGDDESPPGGTINGGNYWVDLVFEENEAPPPHEGSAGFALELAVVAVGDAPEIPPHEGSAALGLQLTLTGTGATPEIVPNEGSAAFSLGLTLAAGGSAPGLPAHEGSAGLGIAYSLSGTGFTPTAVVHEGSAGFTLNLALTAAGDNGEGFPCSPVRSFSEVMG